uniref:FGF1 intracellular binding protein n=1 Tax=Rousettus aegyptiacus TaxID=9407 RepID=A0A7J8GZ55_ROUAE|nr:FGF1 intracellular binding protein [Rousettus aegyptiacus]
MTSELDIFVGNTTLIDEDVYRLWLDGYSVNDAVALRVRSGILVNVAAKLTHNKDVRDLFVDLVEKFVEPCRSDHWPLNDVRLFLNQYSASVHSLDGFRHQALWDRYMGTLRGCLLRLYHD